MGFSLPVSLEIGLVSDERDRPVVATEPLILVDDVEMSGRFVETVSTHDRVDNDERIRPLQIPLWLLVRL